MYPRFRQVEIVGEVPPVHENSVRESKEFFAEEVDKEEVEGNNNHEGAEGNDNEKAEGNNNDEEAEGNNDYEGGGNNHEEVGKEEVQQLRDTHGRVQC